MKSIVLSPHDDDGALFCSFLSIRKSPVHVIVTDSYIQPKRGETGCSAEERAAETEAACRILGCPVLRLGLHDDDVTEGAMIEALMPLTARGLVYGPAQQGGNPHHDMLARAARAVFDNRRMVRYRQYTTYSKTALYTEGGLEIKPTAEELERKAEALACYPSQLRINRAHFDAVRGKSEWLVA